MLKTRYQRILVFFGRLVLGLAFWEVLLPALGLRRLARRGRMQRLRGAAVAFRALAVEMGGVLIKVGQFLSARLDVLPPVVTEELAGLQDEVRPEVFEDIHRVVETEFDARIEQVFAEFDPLPAAAASIGQVHHARLLDAGVDRSLDVVVKVQRPNIEALVATDLAALRVVASWLHRYPPIRKRANVPALLEEFTHTLYEEIDYLNEGKNAETFAENFARRPLYRVPAVYWGTTTRRVLTLERIEAIKITDYAAIEAAGIDRAEVAERLFQSYLKQLLDDRFFHADPHPGNLCVLPLEPAAEGEPREWQLVFLDFGMMGKITPVLFSGIREMLIAVGTQDAARVIRTYQAMDMLLPGANLELIEKGTRRVFERFWGKTMPEMMRMRHAEAIEFAQEFGELLYDLPFQVPENLILLGRCLAILNGICTGLDPNFNVWISIAPFARKLVAEETGGGWEFWLKEIVGALQLAASLPRRTETILQKIEQGKIEVRNPEMKGQVDRLDRSIRRLAAAIVFAALLLAVIQAYLAGQTLLAGGLGVAALIALGWLAGS